MISLSLAACLSLTACVSKNSQNTEQSTAQNSPQDSINTADAQKTEEPDESSERIKQYIAFLQGEISTETKSEGALYFRDYCNIAVPGEDNGLRYAFYDMTGDGLPELHVLTDISFSIHTIKNGQLVEWFSGDRYCRPLNNGAICEKREATGIHYYYAFIDNEGKECGVGFSRPPKGAKTGGLYKYIFGTGDGDNFNEITVSKKEWKKLTKPFLAMRSDKITWKYVSKLDF